MICYLYLYWLSVKTPTTDDLVNNTEQRRRLHRGSGKNGMVSAAQQWQKYHFVLHCFPPATILTLVSYTKMLKTVATSVFTARNLQKSIWGVYDA